MHFSVTNSASKRESVNAFQKKEKASLRIENSGMRREFADTSDGFVTTAFQTTRGSVDLIQTPTKKEGEITLNGKTFILGGEGESSFQRTEAHLTDLKDGGQRLEVSFAAPPTLSDGLLATLVYEAPGNAPVFIKSLRIQNESSKAVRLDGALIEEITPYNSSRASLILENDYVRGAMTIDGESVRSPWIEHQEVYVEKLLNTEPELTRFAYPCQLERMLLPGARFDTFRVFEFAVANSDKELRGLEYRRTTRDLFPWTREKWLNCALAPSTHVEDYYRGIELAAEVGIEAVRLGHGWIDGKLASPLFTNYADYELRSDLFPNGWKDVRKLTDFAHAKGLKISFYTTYVSIWNGEETRAWKDNDWELKWAPDDNSSRWGTTLNPATDWGFFVNRKIEKAMTEGGFDSFHIDGPYYGDVCVAKVRNYKPGGPNQLLAWERQLEFYDRMRDLGFPGEAAQGFPAYANGVSRITSSGHREGDFGKKAVWDQILATRKGAYCFTRVYRPEQGVYQIPVVSWLQGPCMEPMEEHAAQYDAYLANCYGYGFEGKVFFRVPYEGPRSRAAVMRWLNFWKSHEKFFKEGYLIHVREPDGGKIDGVMHILPEKDVFRTTRALLVVYNPSEVEQTDMIELPFNSIKSSLQGWSALSESGETQKMTGCRIHVRVPPQNATWYEIENSQH